MALFKHHGSLLDADIPYTVHRREACKRLQLSGKLLGGDTGLFGQERYIQLRTADILLYYLYYVRKEFLVRGHLPRILGRRAGLRQGRRPSETALLQEAQHLEPEFLGIERLGHECIYAYLYGFVLCNLVSPGRQHYDRDGSAALVRPDPAAELEPVHYGHHHIRDYQVRMYPSEHGDPVPAVPCRIDISYL